MGYNNTYLYIVFLTLFFAPNCAFSTSIELTPKEQNWLNSHKIIRVSGPQAFPPFQYIDTDGTLQGMASDYLLHISKMVGFTIVAAEKQPWPAILRAIQNKEIDLLTCAATTKERATYLNYTNPHLSFPLVIISRNDSPYIGLQGLNKKTVAVTRKNSTIEWLQKDKITARFHYVESPTEALHSVSMGEADATIENLAAATYLIEKNGLANLKVASPTSYGNYSLSIAIRKDWPELTTIINKALAAMSPDEHNTIRSKWISVKYEEGLISIPSIMKWLLTILVAITTIFFLLYFWNRKLTLEILERQKVEKENKKLIFELRIALSEIQTLRGIIPICSHCKKIRDDKGIWNQIEQYIQTHSEAEFSHGICQDCAQAHYPELTTPDETTNKAG